MFHAMQDELIIMSADSVTLSCDSRHNHKEEQAFAMVRAEGLEPSWQLVCASAARMRLGCVYQFRHAR